MKNNKKYVALMLTGMMALSLLAGCGNSSAGSKGSSTAGSAASTQSSSAAESSSAASSTESSSSAAESSAASAGSDFDSSKEIGVITREDGSGTRGAFIELFGIEQKDDSGKKVDHTTEMAVVTDSTSVMMQTVAGDPYAIGYISLGSLDQSVKSVKIDGVEATVENIKSNTYKIARPFNIATKESVSEAAQDFITFIMSADGQKVIEDGGYIPVSEAEAYSGSMASGKIVVGGSSSVTPIMEKLKEAYLQKNPGVTIEMQPSDSSTGMSNAIDGIYDIGMASRELKDSETEKGLKATVIAMDGIAVIVNNGSAVEELASDQVKEIFMGNVTTWADVMK